MTHPLADEMGTNSNTNNKYLHAPCPTRLLLHGVHDAVETKSASIAIRAGIRPYARCRVSQGWFIDCGPREGIDAGCHAAMLCGQLPSRSPASATSPRMA